jgi:hypothetical protein
MDSGLVGPSRTCDNHLVGSEVPLVGQVLPVKPSLDALHQGPERPSSLAELVREGRGVRVGATEAEGDRARECVKCSGQLEQEGVPVPFDETYVCLVTQERFSESFVRQSPFSLTESFEVTPGYPELLPRCLEVLLSLLFIGQGVGSRDEDTPRSNR